MERDQASVSQMNFLEEKHGPLTGKIYFFYAPVHVQFLDFHIGEQFIALEFLQDFLCQFMHVNPPCCLG
jgi:hypothetical protein